MALETWYIYIYFYLKILTQTKHDLYETLKEGNMKLSKNLFELFTTQQASGGPMR